VQGQVLGLVRERVDVRARVLGITTMPGRAGARLARATRVVAVQEVVEAGRVRRVGGRTCVAELFEVEDASRLELFEEVFSPYEDQSR